MDEEFVNNLHSYELEDILTEITGSILLAESLTKIKELYDINLISIEELKSFIKEKESKI